VNGRLLPKYVNRQVSLVGRVLNSNDMSTILEASDQQQVQIYHRNGNMSLPQQSIVEIIGQVNPDASIKEISRTAFSDNFNLSTYDEVIKLSQRPELELVFGR